MKTKDVSSRIFYMDEGIIYEEGTPEEIFENPKKKNTQMFINRIRNFYYRINSADYDLYQLNAEIMNFCMKHLFSKKIEHNILLLVEECLQIIPLRNGADLLLDYSEKTGEITLNLEMPLSAGSILNGDNEPDMISISIINGLTHGLKESIANEKVLLSAVLKQI